MSALPIIDAARALGMRPGTLKRHVRNGCPTAARGSRGRGRVCLVDPEAVKEWLAADERTRIVRGLADAVPELLARAAAEAHRLTQGLDARTSAGLHAAHWYVAAVAILDFLRERDPSVVELVHFPAPRLIARMAQSNSFAPKATTPARHAISPGPSLCAACAMPASTRAATLPSRATAGRPMPSTSQKRRRVH